MKAFMDYVIPGLIIVLFGLLISMAGFCLYRDLTGADNETITINILKIDYMFDSGFQSYDRTIVYTSAGVLTFHGIQYLPLGNVTLVIAQTYTNGDLRLVKIIGN
jgi:drug/metabolite transporter (DMT)-like permease